MNNSRSINMFVATIYTMLFLSTAFSIFGQTLGYERGRHQDILQTVKADIEKYYYDPNFHGIDLEARFNTAKEKIKTAASVSEMSAIIAQVLVDFNDSHLFYNPPGKASKTEYGWEMQMIGDKCFITSVTPGSDAEKQGLKPGDEIFSLNGYGPTRDNVWKLNYLYRVIRPQPAIKLGIAKPDGKEIELIVKSKITDKKRMVEDSYDFVNYFRENDLDYEKSRRQRYYEGIDNLIVWKMPQFALTPNEVDSVMDKVGKRQAIILDLRGNGGGRVDMLSKLIGNFFPEDLKIGELKERKKTKSQMAKTRGKDYYKGKIAILIDSDSASASEVFARVMQLEKRATIIGDRSAGAVMTSMHYSHQVGQEVVLPFGVSITIADLILSDGKSLEKVGVIPDEQILPTAMDLANKKDPVLARAAEALGFQLSADQAGKIFPADKN